MTNKLNRYQQRDQRRLQAGDVRRTLWFKPPAFANLRKAQRGRTVEDTIAHALAKEAAAS